MPKPKDHLFVLGALSLDQVFIVCFGLLWIVLKSAKVIQPQFATPKNTHMQWSHKQSLYNVQDFPFIGVCLNM